MKEYWKEENLRPITENSQTQKEVLIKLGLRAAGGNSKTLNKYLKLYNIDTSHFKKNWENMIERIRSDKIPTSAILVRDSTYGRSSLKKRLYTEGLKEKFCEMCGQGEIWRDKKMSLILDHINGIYNDNRIENLRIVCPNCNATLPTHCGANKNKKPDKNINLSYDQIREILKTKTRYQFLKKYGTYINKNRLNDLEMLDKIKGSDVDFNEFGWVAKISDIIGISPQKGGYWLKRIDPAFHSQCYQRKSS